MKCLTYRLGFATNSSSTHSIILMTEKETEQRKRRHDSQDARAGEFGWNTFSAYSPEAKTQYLVSSIFSNLGEHADSERKWQEKNKELISFVRKFFRDIELNRESYVDHQSLLLIPRAFGKPTPPCSWVTHLHTVLQNPRVAIFGGNDNDGRHRDLPQGDRLILAPKECGSGKNFVARREGDQWVVFNQTSGTKIRGVLGDTLTPCTFDPNRVW